MNLPKTWGALLALLLAACAALAPDQRADVPPAAPFDLLGRVSVSYDGRAFSSNVRWQHTAQSDEIWLMSPVGQTLAHIIHAADGAVLTAADRQQYQASSVESLTRRALGWELPLARLQYWVRGLAAPDSVPDSFERDAAQRPAALAQDGWRIAYINYPPDQQGGLPRRLDLARGSQAIRLVIDDWRGETPAP
ncbi:MAG: lipoprotein insertase outer membrane protein LolB [Pseudomonadota bacterium]